MQLIARLVAAGFLAMGVGLAIPMAALAYGGPGSIISGIGAFLAVLAALVASIFGFLWFPLKRLIRKVRGDGGESEQGSTEPADGLASE
jgi:hypothetical protein